MSDKGSRKSGEEGIQTLYIGFLAIGLIIGILLGVAVGTFVVPQTQSFSSIRGLTPEEAGEKAVDFINSNLPLPPGAEVTLEEVKEENGVYNVTIDYMGNQLPMYITKDGEILFLQGIGWIKLEDFEVKVEAQKEQEQNPL